MIWRSSVDCTVADTDRYSQILTTSTKHVFWYQVGWVFFVVGYRLTQHYNKYTRAAYWEPPVLSHTVMSRTLLESPSLSTAEQTLGSRVRIQRGVEVCCFRHCFCRGLTPEHVNRGFRNLIPEIGQTWIVRVKFWEGDTRTFLWASRGCKLIPVQFDNPFCVYNFH